LIQQHNIEVVIDGKIIESGMPHLLLDLDALPGPHLVQVIPPHNHIVSTESYGEFAIAVPRREDNVGCD
jgi:hypothetical protein